MKTDTLFYEIFQMQPGLLLELLGQEGDDISQYDFRSVEIKQTAQRIDGLLIPKGDRLGSPVYFSEIQFQKDVQIYHRFFAEIFTYLKQCPDTPGWHGILIFPRRSLLPPQKYWHLYRSQFQGGQVSCIYLEDLTDRPDRTLGVEIIQLIIQSKSRAKGFAKQLIQRVQQEEPQDLPRTRLLDLIETILVYKFGNLTTQELEAMFGLSELKKTRVYQEGRDEGREETIVALLQRRFSTIDPALRSAVPKLAALPLSQALDLILERSREEIIDRFSS
jgi:predicted transposase/invertase (TIGR01784 family)